MDFFGKVKGFFFSPSEAFKREQKSSLMDGLKYIIITGAVFSILYMILIGSAMALFLPVLAIAIPVLLIFIWIIIVTGAFVGGLVLHVFAYLFGGRKGVEQTIKVVIYSSTPSMLLGWIPLIGVVFIIWSVVLEVIGLKQLQGLSTGRAVVAVLIPILIGIMLFFSAFLFFMSLVPTETPGLSWSPDIAGTGSCTLDDPGFPFCSMNA